MNPTATSMPVLDFYLTAVELVESRIHEIFDTRLNDPNTQDPMSEKELELAMRLLKSGLDIRSKIAKLTPAANDPDPKSKSSTPNSPSPDSPAPKSPAIPLAAHSAHSAPLPTSAPAPTPAPMPPSASAPPPAPTSTPTPPVGPTPSTPSTSPTSSAPPLKFRLSESATQRYIKERQHQLAAQAAAAARRRARSAASAQTSSPRLAPRPNKAQVP